MNARELGWFLGIFIFSYYCDRQLTWVAAINSR